MAVSKNNLNIKKIVINKERDKNLLVDEKIFKGSGLVNFFVVIIEHSFVVFSFLGLGQDARVVPNPAQVLDVVEKTSLFSS